MPLSLLQQQPKQPSIETKLRTLRQLLCDIERHQQKARPPVPVNTKGAKSVLGIKQHQSHIKDIKASKQTTLWDRCNSYYRTLQQQQRDTKEDESKNAIKMQQELIMQQYSRLKRNQKKFLEDAKLDRENGRLHHKYDPDLSLASKTPKLQNETKFIKVINLPSVATVYSPANFKVSKGKGKIKNQNSASVSYKNNTNSSTVTNKIEKKTKSVVPDAKNKTKKKSKSLDSDATNRIKKKQKSVDSDTTKKLEKKPKSVDSDVTKKLEKKPKSVDFDATNKIEKKPKSVDSDATSKIEQKPKSVDSDATSKIEMKQKSLVSDTSNQIEQNPKTLDSDATKQIEQKPKSVDSDTTLMPEKSSQEKIVQEKKITSESPKTEAHTDISKYRVLHKDAASKSNKTIQEIDCAVVDKILYQQPDLTAPALPYSLTNKQDFIKLEIQKAIKRGKSTDPVVNGLLADAIAKAQQEGIPSTVIQNIIDASKNSLNSKKVLHLLQIQFRQGVYILCTVNTCNFTELILSLDKTIHSFKARFAPVLHHFTHCCIIEALVPEKYRQFQPMQLSQHLNLEAKSLNVKKIHVLDAARGAVSIQCLPVALPNFSRVLESKGYKILNSDYGFRANKEIDLDIQAAAEYRKLMNYLKEIPDIETIADNVLYSKSISK